jgi:hypothetical protein
MVSPISANVQPGNLSPASDLPPPDATQPARTVPTRFETVVANPTDLENRTGLNFAELWGGNSANSPQSSPTGLGSAGGSDTALIAQATPTPRPVSTIQPNAAEEKALKQFTPNYKPGGNAVVLPGTSPSTIDGVTGKAIPGPIGTYDQQNKRAVVWQGGASAQAQYLGVNPQDFERAIAIQELSHAQTKQQYPGQSKVQTLELMGDAVTAAAYPQIGALNSLANALNSNLTPTGPNPRDTYAAIGRSVSTALDTAAKRAGGITESTDRLFVVAYHMQGTSGTLRQRLDAAALNIQNDRNPATGQLNNPNFDAKAFVNAALQEIPLQIQRDAAAQMKTNL